MAGEQVEPFPAAFVIGGLFNIPYYEAEMRSRFGLGAALFVAFLVVVLWWQFRRQQSSKQVGTQSVPTDTKASPAGKPKRPDIAPTRIDAHNLMLRKGPNFRV
jgi:hypothetical protein